MWYKRCGEIIIFFFWFFIFQIGKLIVATFFRSTNDPKIIYFMNRLSLCAVI